MRYRLRTLLIIVTALCIVLGYVTNWRFQRHRFLTEQALRSQGAVAQYQTKRWEHSVLSVNCRASPESSYNRPPLLLRLLGERGYHAIVISVPASDITPQQADNGHGVPLAKYYALNSQTDYERAVRLFPEASIWPCTYINGTVHEVFVRDAKTGRIVVYNYGPDAEGENATAPMADLNGQTADHE